ncbi:MAG: substrate-binding domain-containing protein [Dysgonamonadaceae bacterium]|jgi:ABC-type sugar transport system substrate-binding protein/signal transduction histidine kinase/DNA-binding response OmpR family regulator|nr:substrate-binding domain-containing protein [Dysgonamonadaceae bacterium]
MLKYCPRLCVIVLIFILLACTEKQKIYTVGVSQCSNDEWRKKMCVEMQQEAMLHPDMRLEIRLVADDTEKQIADIQSFIDRKIDLIIVAPNKAAPVTPVVERAYNAGIPVILVDRKVLSDKYTAFIGADNYQIGEDVGNYIAKLLNGKGNVLEICGLEGSSPASERHQGFISAIIKHENINLLQSVDGAWLKDIAENKMEDAMRIFPEIDVVYSHNDRMAMGAYSAAVRENRASNIAFVGIDALPGTDGGIEQVLEGKLKATFIYPTNGEKIVQLAADILHNRPFEKTNGLYSSIVDETNARVLKLQTDIIIEQDNKIGFLNGKIDSYLTQYTTQRYLLLVAIIVVALFVLFFILIFRVLNSKNRLNREMAKRNAEINRQKELTEQQRDQLIELSKQLEEATQAKLVFFTNISHEFRTPLTLISGPINSLLADKNISRENIRLLSLAKKNANILLELIDQIIDFRKYENGKMKLHLSSHNLYNQLNELNESFYELAKHKHLNFNFLATGNDYEMIYDMEKMERIYFNLLSNAFKFTPEKGFISVDLNKLYSEKGNFAMLKISNSGRGISKNDLKHIFERFYQVNSQAGGSGIGLALVKALVELHGGKISADYDETAAVNTFYVAIPILSDKNAENAIQNQYKKLTGNTEFLKETKDDYIFDNEIDKENELILVIDDNPDIRSYIKTVLQNQYSIIEAKDGAEGLRKAFKYIPDLIVSDVMMPPPDGIELCRRLKSELSTNHIPVILLTAYSLDEQKITGFESGADDFIAKPFNSDILEVRIKNLIENRKNLKNAFQKHFPVAENKEILNDTDKNFIEKLKTLIEKNISNTDLNVEDLGQNIGLSRTQLYRKVKNITGYSPVELLKIIRLKKAFKLLTSSELSISETAYETGFTSPSYFAKCFKEHYNESPTDYLKRLKNL